MKNLLKIIGFVGLLGCEIPDISFDLAHKPDTNLFYQDTTSQDSVYSDSTLLDTIPTTPLDSIVFPVDTITSPVDSIVVPIDTIQEPIYTPINTDGNIFLNAIYNSYAVGDRFDYSFILYNLTDKSLFFNNFEGDKAINYKMFCNEKIGWDESIVDEFKLEIKPNGYFGMNKKENALELIICGVKIEMDKTYNIPYPLELTITKEAKNQYFEEKGEYHFEFDIKYFMDDKKIESQFYSEKFEVFE